jgi:hypothetical protein
MTTSMSGGNHTWMRPSVRLEPQFHPEDFCTDRTVMPSRSTSKVGLSWFIRFSALDPEPPTLRSTWMRTSLPGVAVTVTSWNDASTVSVPPGMAARILSSEYSMADATPASNSGTRTMRDQRRPLCMTTP